MDSGLGPDGVAESVKDFSGAGRIGDRPNGNLRAVALVGGWRREWDSNPRWL